MCENKKAKSLQLNRQEDNNIFNNAFFNITPLVCALMVVLIHSYINNEQSKLSTSNLIMSFLSHGLCTAAVPTFFFMSGWLFYHNVEVFKDVFYKQKKRIKTVLVPFLAWSLIYYLFYLLGAQLFNIQISVEFSLSGLLRGVIFYEYIFPMWYMFQLCIFVILAPLIFYILKNKIVSIIVLIVSVLIGFIAPNSIKINIGTLEREIFQINFFGYYFLGCFLSRQQKNLQKINFIIDKISLWLLIGLLVVFSGIESLFFEGVILSFNSRCAVPLIFVLFLILMIKTSKAKNKFRQPLVSTMIIYGIHPFVGIVLQKVLFAAVNFPIFLEYIISYLLVVAVSFAIGYIMKKVKPIYQIFSGNR